MKRPACPCARIALILTLSGASLLLAGCGSSGKSGRLQAEIPPDIPPPPVISSRLGPLNPEAETLRRHEVEKERYLAFRQAFTFARDHRLIDAQTTPDAPFWQAPVTRARLAQWLAPFVKGTTGEGSSVEFADIPEEHPQAAAIAAVAAHGWLAGVATHGERAFLPDAPVTREALCDLLVRVQGEADAVAKTRSAVIDQLRPPNAQENGENFENFKDRDAITPHLGPAVAWAYQRNLPEAVFGLSPLDLTAREGFKPGQTVSTREALTFIGRFVMTPPEAADAVPPAATTAPAPSVQP